MKKIFISLFSKYTENAEMYWNDLVNKYSHKSRYYHNLSHLKNMLKMFKLVKDQFTCNSDDILMALFYHDYVYDVYLFDNEEQSAAKVVKILYEIDYPFENTEYVVKLILATCSHKKSKDENINLFVDIDLAILGSVPKTYEKYFQNIRKEYSVFPDSMYNHGRINILKSLKKDGVFSTQYFKQLFENDAIRNISCEIIILEKQI